MKPILITSLIGLFLISAAQAGYQYRVSAPNIGIGGGDANIASVPTSCTGPDWAGEIQDAASITAYQSSVVSYGSSCVSELRTCANTVLGGSFTHQSCSVASPTYPVMQLGSAISGNPANTVTENGLRFTINNTGGSGGGDWRANDMAFASSCKTSGKWYWEMQIIGVGNSGYIGATYSTSSAYPSATGMGMYSQGGTSYTGVASTTSSTYGGKIVGFILDMDARTIRTTINGAPQAANTYVFPVDSCVRPASGVSTFWGGLDARMNFGGTPFAYTPPVGFNGFTAN